MSRVVEVELANFPRFFFLQDRAVFFLKAQHLTDLNRRLVHFVARFNVKMQPSSKSDDDDRQTDELTDYCNLFACVLSVNKMLSKALYPARRWHLATFTGLSYRF